MVVIKRVDCTVNSEIFGENFIFAINVKIHICIIKIRALSMMYLNQ